MNKYILGLFIALLAAAAIVFAQPDLTPTEMDVGPSQGHATVTIPAHAIEVAPDIFFLGTAVHEGRVVEGYAAFHHREGHDGGPPGSGGDGGDDTTSSCFDFLARGAKWKTVEPYIVDPTNTEGISDSSVRTILADAIAEWEDAADGTVDGTIGADVLGDEVPGDVDGADTDSPDDKNEVLWGNVDSSGAIAVTIVWGIFRGPPQNRELVEWDQVYDQVDFDWSDTGEAGKMDFENIAQHELGHSVGLGHPSDECTEETMYRFADEGETKKRTLEAGDIAGVSELY